MKEILKICEDANISIFAEFQLGELSPGGTPIATYAQLDPKTVNPNFLRYLDITFTEEEKRKIIAGEEVGDNIHASSPVSL